VTVTRVSFSGRDLAGGRSPAATALPQAYRVAIHPADAADAPEHMREQEVVYLTVRFYDDPQLRTRDEVVDELGRVLVVIGVKGPSGGYHRSWPVVCEYRPPAGKA